MRKMKEDLTEKIKDLTAEIAELQVQRRAWRGCWPDGPPPASDGDHAFEASAPPAPCAAALRAPPPPYAAGLPAHRASALRAPAPRASALPAQSPTPGSCGSASAAREEATRSRGAASAAGRPTPRRPAREEASEEDSQATTMKFVASEIDIFSSHKSCLRTCWAPCRDGIARATDMMIGDKRATSCGYAAVSKGCAFALRRANARVLFTAIAQPAFQGGSKASSTNDGLTKDKLLKNKRDKVLSKKTSAACATKRASKIAKDRFAQPAFQGGFSGDLTDDKFDKNKYSRMATFYGGVNEDTTTGGLTLRKLAAKDAQVFLAMGVEIRGTSPTEDADFEARCRAMSAWMACGPGDMGKGCAFALRCANARVLITESELIGALQVCIGGFQVVTIESVAGEIYIFTSDTGDFNVILLAHKKNMEGFRVVTIESVESDIDIFTSAADNFNVITLQLMSKIARGKLAKAMVLRGFAVEVGLVKPLGAEVGLVKPLGAEVELVKPLGAEVGLVKPLGLTKVEVKDELFKNERGKVKSVMSEIDIFTSMAGNFNIIYGPIDVPMCDVWA
jgi:hypothetical protein